ncbi:MAG: hypothetical protein JSR82_17635 [Verrucomicrobia bacterium]|nr:hypothetical protein [Verrucomicrobiota bacterium]
MLFLLSTAAIALIFATDLEAFPNYFLADEAIHPVQFQALAANQWRAIYPPHEVLPAFFRNVFKYNLSLSVYGQGLSELLFGRSVATIRGTSVALCLSAMLAVALALRRAGLREWWLAVPVSGCLPAWFLHSRTGFEVTFTVGCFGWFLYFYLRYRQGDGWCILPAMLAGAGTFYGYSNGQGLMLVCAVILLLAHLRHHWQLRGWAAAGLLFALLLFLPYLRFRWQHPEMVGEHLRDVESYLHDRTLTAGAKALQFLKIYGWGLSPVYWFQPDLEPVARHQVPTYGNAHFALLPLVLAGMVAGWRWRGPAALVFVVAWLAGPATAAISGISSNRVLAMCLPLAAAAAAGWTLLSHPVRTPALHSLLRWGGGGLVLLLAWSIQLDARALGAQQTRHQGLYGMQWGAQAIYRETLPELACLHPQAKLNVTHVWANNSDVFLPYFGFTPFPNRPERQVSLVNLTVLVNEPERVPAAEDLNVLTESEYGELLVDPAVASHRVHRRLRGPDGSVHFRVVSFTLKPDWPAIRRAAKMALAKPVESVEEICGGPARVLLGGADGSTAARVLRAGPGVTRCYPDIPLTLVIDFEQPREVEEIAFHHWENGHATITARALGAAGELAHYHHVADISGGAPQLETWKIGATGVTRLEITVSAPPLDIAHLRYLLIRGRPVPSGP